jgi:hypothetical protein
MNWILTKDWCDTKQEGHATQKVGKLLIRNASVAVVYVTHTKTYVCLVKEREHLSIRGRKLKE